MHFEAEQDKVNVAETRLMAILPIYNESKDIEGKMPSFFAFAQEHPSFHFRFVDDGSSDHTADILQSSIEAYAGKNVSLLRLPENLGKGGAIRAGIASTEAKRVCFMDGDLAYSPSHLVAMDRELDAFDIVIGSRTIGRQGRNTLRRKLLGWGFNRLARSIIGLPYSDTQSGLKGFRREAADKIFNHQIIHGFSFDVEMLYLAKKYGFSVGEIQATVSEDHSYKKGKVKLLKDSLLMLKEIIMIRVHDIQGKYE